MFIDKNKWALLCLIIIIAGGGYAAYIFEEDRHATNARLSAVESQLTTLNTALEESGAVTTADAEQIKEIANRSTVIAKSQDDLLTTTVAKAAPAVVSIVISKDIPQLDIQYVNPFGDDPNFNDVPIRVPTYHQVGTQSQEIGAGTGFIIRQDGYIITNKHVVDTPDATYTVLLSTGTKKVATVIYRDPTEDIAILRIDGSGYATIPLGDSTAIKLGQTVTAIGNALGEYNNSVSVGIVSGLNRTIEASDGTGKTEELKGIIQTDAAINRGNSGGPLLDLNGTAIGVNVAMSQGANSIGFSIPIAQIKAIVARVLQ